MIFDLSLSMNHSVTPRMMEEVNGYSEKVDVL